MPRQRGNGPEHARARRQVQQATVRGLVAGALAEVHAAHAAALQAPAGSARNFLVVAALPAVRALNGAGTPMLLPLMHRVVNAVKPGLIGFDATLYGYSMEWHPSKQSGRPLSMEDALRLTGEGSATSLHSSATARTRPHM